MFTSKNKRKKLSCWTGRAISLAELARDDDAPVAPAPNCSPATLERTSLGEVARTRLTSAQWIDCTGGGGRWRVRAQYAVIRSFVTVILFGCASTTGNSERTSLAGSSNGDGGAQSDVGSTASSSGAGNGGHTAEGGSITGGGEVGAGAGGGAIVLEACRPGASFTACVKTCGEPDHTERRSAECVNGFYACAEPLVPAVACPADSWPDGPYAGCGPWVDGYDCSFTAVCDDGLWSCPGPSNGD